MKKNIKISIISLIIIITGYITYIYYPESSPSTVHAHKSKDWVTYKKDKDSISSYKTGQAEIIENNLGHTFQNSNPASTKSHKINGRRVVGQSLANKKRIFLKNKISTSWINKLGFNLLKYQFDDTYAFIKPKESLIKIKGRTAKYIEHVTVTYKLPSGQKSSFDAMVDSQTGEIINTWGKSIQENYGHETVVKISPDNIDN